MEMQIAQLMATQTLLSKAILLLFSGVDLSEFLVGSGPFTWKGKKL